MSVGGAPAPCRRLSPTRRGLLIGAGAVAAYGFPLTLPGLPEARRTGAPSFRSDRFRDRLAPALAQARRDNEGAARRAVLRIDETFESYKERLPAFVEDVLSTSRSVQIVWHSTMGWLWGDDRAEDFIAGLFRKHVFSEKTVEADLAMVLAAFQDDLSAVSNSLFLDIDLAAQAVGVRLNQAVTSGRFAESVLAHAADRAAGAARVEAAIIPAGLLLSGAAMTAAGMIGSRLAAGLAARAAAAGGGAAIGSWAPVVGTIVGAVVGFIAEMLAQRWLEDKAKDGLVAELEAKLDEVRRRMIDGEPQGTGLAADLQAAVAAFSQAQDSAARSLVNGAGW